MSMSLMTELIRSHQTRVEEQQTSIPAYSMCRSLSSNSWLRVPSRLANRLAPKDKHGGEEVAMVIRQCKRNRDYQINVRPKHSIFTRMVWITKKQTALLL